MTRRREFVSENAIACKHIVLLQGSVGRSEIIRMHLCRQAESYDDWIDNRVFGQSVSPDHMIICDALDAAVSCYLTLLVLRLACEV